MSKRSTAKLARRTILDIELGRKAVILTGNTPRHKKTAALIGKRVTNETITLQEGTPSLQPHSVDPSLNIAPSIKADLSEAPDGQPVIIVTSPEAIASAQGLQDANQITPGAVYDFNFKAYKLNHRAGLTEVPPPGV